MVIPGMTCPPVPPAAIKKVCWFFMILHLAIPKPDFALYPGLTRLYFDCWLIFSNMPDAASAVTTAVPP